MNNEIVELQIKLAHQENSMDVLNEVVVRQQKQIDALASLCEELKDKLVSISSVASEASVQEEMPPHY